MTAPLAVERRDGVVTLRFDRADVGNALDLPLATAIRAAVAELAAAPPSIIVLTGTGRMFCSGGDVRTMAAAGDRTAHLAELAGTIHEALVALRALPVPIVAAVNGTAAGAGIGLVAAADIAVAVDTAKFRTAYGNIGLSPDCGVTALLPALIGARRAALFTLTDLVLDAPTALEWGLLTEVCAADELQARTAAVVAALTARPSAAIGPAARLLRASAERPYADQLADEGAEIARLASTPQAAALIARFGGG